MRNVTRLLMLFAFGILGMLAGGRPVWAQNALLQYQGGPFLETVKIYPLYYGSWTQAEINAHYAYLVKIAAYMSGENAPPEEQPVMNQYGVHHVSVGPLVTASATPKELKIQDVENIISANQGSSGILPPYGPHTLIAVFPGEGFSIDESEWPHAVGGYHLSAGDSAYFMAVWKNQGNLFDLVVCHELFEESASAAPKQIRGWTEAVDGCDVHIPLPSGIEISSPHDNTQGGNCSQTGYTSLGEQQDYGVTYDQFMSDYHTFFPLGWRLYILQSYVLANGDVRYNAVWRPGIEDEVLLPNATRAQILFANTTLNSEGSRLSILQSYVLANGDVRYNAVWQEGTESNTLRLGQTQAQFTAAYNTLTAKNQRLYILQTYVTASGEVLTNSVWRPGVAVEGLITGVTYSAYEVYYDLLQADYRLYILQPYVLSDGSVRYNGLLRIGNHEEKQVHGLTYANYRAMYDSLWPDGWRLYMLNTYVLPGDDVRYDAVWRLGTIDRPL